MDYLFRLRWGMVNSIISGNLEIEQLMESVKLHAGEYWVVIANRRGHWFAGSRKAKLRGSGKGQIAFGGVVGASCELIQAITSSGKPIQFLELIERPAKPLSVHYVAPVDVVPLFE